VTPYFLGADHELRLGHYTATSPIGLANSIDLGTGIKTIRVERGLHDGPDAELIGKLSSPNKAILRVVGNGRLDVSAYTDQLRISHLQIAGAEFRLTQSKISNQYQPYLAASDIIVEITNGGKITLDTQLLANPNIIHIQTRYSFNAGNLLHISKIGGESYEGANEFNLLGGSNGIHLEKSDAFGNPDMLYSIKTLNHTHPSATLNVSSNKTFSSINSVNSVRLAIDNAAVYEFGAGNSGAPNSQKVIPWMTVNGTDFAKTTNAGGETYIQTALYASGDFQNNWISSNNVSVTSNVTLNSDKTINSLRITDGSTLNLGDRKLTINSGGLLSTGTGTTTITGSSGSTITTTDNRPLYVHVYNDQLRFANYTGISGYIDLVKTGPGTLNFDSNISTSYNLGSMYINEGKVILSRYSKYSFAGRIYVGDGAGTDILVFPPAYRGQDTGPFLTSTPNVFHSITLHGNPHDPRGPEYGGDQAILQMSGDTKVRLQNLHIQDRGTIDWVSGNVGQANILYLDTLTFSGPDAILFMRNWFEYEDYLLVRTNGFDLSYLQNVRFEGYENFPVVWRKYDQYYHQITPFGPMSDEGTPEPATTGAILAAVGIGLWALRKRTLRPKWKESLTPTTRGAAGEVHRNRGLIQNRDLCSVAKRPVKS